MSVELDPVELGFRRPFNREVSQILKLRNPHSEPVAFKVKTTAPKQYCVRPNNGRIDPGSEVEVQVLLQAMKEDPPADAKCRDKFLVQSVIVGADKEFSNMPQVWANIEQTAKSSIQEKKIRVVFLPADSSAPAATPARVNGAHMEETPAQATPDAVTPSRGMTPAVGAFTTHESQPAGSKPLSSIVQEAHNPAAPTRSSPEETPAAGATLGTVPTSVEELKAQLSEAQAKITQLTREATEGLRKRNVTGSASTSNETAKGTSSLGMVQQQAAAAGVPVQLVAVLCLVSFLLAYFFF